jgi:NAD(P)-binding Rossmann-like domain
MEDWERPNMDAVLLASRVPYTVNLFVVGPFATRVSFASQQRRALTLITAIHRDLKRAGDPVGLEGKTVGIVGAGLAGLTCAVAAAAFGAQTQVFEKERGPLTDLSKAEHREIHPTINFWPVEDIEPTTRLPFFNWYHSKCHLVARRIRENWSELCRTNPNLLPIKTFCNVVDIKLQNNKWRIRGQRMMLDSGPGATTIPAPEPESDWPYPFDLLILATGFGVELFAPNSNTPSYWNFEEDSIKRLSARARPPASGHAASPCKHYVVSGTGDGGTIEALRLLYDEFQAGGFESVTAVSLRDSNLRREISRIESDVQRTLSDMVLHRRFPLADKDRDQISEMLWERYIDVVRRRLRPTRASDEFKDLSRTAIGKVVLLGQRSTPLEFAQAPYHKLFLAYSVDRGLVDFYQLAGNANASDSLLNAATRTACEDLRITLKDINFGFRRHLYRDGRGAWHEDSTPGDLTLKSCFYISRHGYKSPVDSLASKVRKATPKQIRKRQSLYADQDWLTLDQFDDYAKRLKQKSPKQPSAWAKEFEPDVVAYFEENHSLTLKSTGLGEIDKDDADKSLNEVYYVLSPVVENFDIGKYERNLSRLPLRFFGVPVHFDPGDIMRDFSHSGYSSTGGTS